MKIEINNQEVRPEDIQIKDKVGLMKKDGKPDCGYVCLPKSWIGQRVRVINSKEIPNKEVKRTSTGTGIIYLPKELAGKMVIVIKEVE